jgi:hypothetical protein
MTDIHGIDIVKKKIAFQTTLSKYFIISWNDTNSVTTNSLNPKSDQKIQHNLIHNFIWTKTKRLIDQNN